MTYESTILPTLTDVKPHVFVSFLKAAVRTVADVTELVVLTGMCAIFIAVFTAYTAYLFSPESVLFGLAAGVFISWQAISEQCACRSKLR